MVVQKRVHFKIKEFSRFGRAVGEQRSSGTVVIQQLSWKIVAKHEVDEQTGVRYLGFYVQCNAQDSRISDWNCVAGVVLQVQPRMDGICPMQQKYHEQQFTAGNNCCGNPRMVTMERLMCSENGWCKKDNIILEAIITANSPYFQFYDLSLLPLHAVLPIPTNSRANPFVNDIYKPDGSIVLKIEKLSEFARESANNRRLSSTVYLRGLPWNILAISHAHDNCLGYFLQCNADYADANWSCAASVTLSILAQKEGKEDLVRKYTHMFNANQKCWGWRKFTTFEVLMDPENGWYDGENDTAFLTVDVTADAPHGVKVRASLADRMTYFLSSGKDANVHFLVGSGEGTKEQFAAHKGILATISYVFDRMFDFDSNQGNSDKMVEVTDVKPEAFRVMLDYIYTTNLDGLRQENVFDILHAANKYDIGDLIDACADCPKLDANNVLYALGKALLYDVKSLIARCWQFIDLNACAVLGNDQFVEVDQALLCKLFARDQLALLNGEIAIWNAAIRWADAHCHKHNMEPTGDNRRNILGPALFHIRFPLIPRDQFASTIVPTKVLTEKEMLSVLLYQANPTNNGSPGEYPLEFSAKVRAR